MCKCNSVADCCCEDVTGKCGYCGKEEYVKDLVEHTDSAITCKCCEKEYLEALREEG